MSVAAPAQSRPRSRSRTAGAQFLGANRRCIGHQGKLRDAHGTIFGDGVVVLGVSGDSLGSHASWARELRFPFALVSDPDLRSRVSTAPRFQEGGAASRTVFVIDGGGTLRYRELRFGALSEDAYTKRAQEVAKAKS